jgi:hypothetical protein
MVILLIFSVLCLSSLAVLWPYNCKGNHNFGKYQTMTQFYQTKAQFYQTLTQFYQTLTQFKVLLLPLNLLPSLSQPFPQALRTLLLGTSRVVHRPSR